MNKLLYIACIIVTTFFYLLFSDGTSLDFIQKMKDQGFYATGVHINNNIYSVFGNKVDLPGVNEFMKKYVAIPSGWWFHK